MSATPREEFWGIYRETLPILLIALGGGLFAGLVLEEILESVERFPGLLVMVPVFLATRGNVYGALGGRIASGIHQGLLPPRFEWNERLVNAVIASFINGIGISIVIGFISWGALNLLGMPAAAWYELVGIMLLAGAITSVVMIFGLLALIFLGYRMGYDPDNLVGPIVTTLGDIFGMLFLLISVLVIDGLFEVII
ncbi:magnesium transporter [Natranaeroarchaeum sulfidigenes]|uniref:Permease, similar to cation transporter n=1 Tax=Natranaeroarchaeum sulfidigenes TaxID=2784880 RepID=A0A897MTP2_9EURY|nr:magnesium transporter [Natranaeroarchaeum sulfidigenes]QSG02319.1 Permease, similar to cation transporter [Natranaeroarchaeum sulfidigenes]